MKKEIYYTSSKLILKSNIYFDVNPAQFNDNKNIIYAICFEKKGFVDWQKP